jgi:hypothetical protein
MPEKLKGEEFALMVAFKGTFLPFLQIHHYILNIKLGVIKCSEAFRTTAFHRHISCKFP